MHCAATFVNYHFPLSILHNILVDYKVRCAVFPLAELVEAEVLDTFRYLPFDRLRGRTDYFTVSQHSC